MAEFTKRIYLEDGGTYLVDKLSDERETRDDGEWRILTVRCIRTIEPSPLIGSIRPGQEWTSEAKVGYEHYCGWTLVFPPADMMRKLQDDAQLEGPR